MGLDTLEDVSCIGGAAESPLLQSAPGITTGRVEGALVAVGEGDDSPWKARLNASIALCPDAILAVVEDAWASGRWCAATLLGRSSYRSTIPVGGASALKSLDLAAGISVAALVLSTGMRTQLPGDWSAAGDGPKREDAEDLLATGWISLRKLLGTLRGAAVLSEQLDAFPCIPSTELDPETTVASTLLIVSDEYTVPAWRRTGEATSSRI